MSLPRSPHGSSASVEVDPLALNDLTDLPNTPTADELLSIIRARFNDGLLYSDLSSRVLVSVNPFQDDQSSSAAVRADWTAEYGECGNEGVRGRLSPHLFGTSNKAYYYMRRTGQDQTILLR